MQRTIPAPKPLQPHNRCPPPQSEHQLLSENSRTQFLPRGKKVFNFIVHHLTPGGGVNTVALIEKDKKCERATKFTFRSCSAPPPPPPSRRHTIATPLPDPPDLSKGLYIVAMATRGTVPGGFIHTVSARSVCVIIRAYLCWNVSMAHCVHENSSVWSQDNAELFCVPLCWLISHHRIHFSSSNNSIIIITLLIIITIIIIIIIIIIISPLASQHHSQHEKRISPDLLLSHI